MVAKFNRSFSLSGPKTRSASEKSYHVRSISLPCRAHPLISQLEYEIRSVHAWLSTRPEPDSRSGSWICDGLARLDLLHSSLVDLLNLPQNQDSLRRGSGSAWSDRVLDDFLRLADAHCTFRSEMETNREIHNEAQIAIRRRDEVEISSCIRSMKKIEKELIKLASLIREISKSPISSRFTIGSVEEAELAGVIREVISITVSVSAAVFLEAVAVAAATSAAVAAAAGVKANGWMAMRRSSRSVKTSDEGEDCRRSAMEDWKEERSGFWRWRVRTRSCSSVC